MKKQMIKDSLIKQGRDVFSRYGLQKTTINEITTKVGIATGTFYNYFHSKEELYFEILEEEEKKIKKQFTDAAIEKNSHPKQALKSLLNETVHVIETNPFIRQLYFENNMNQLMSKLPRERLEQHFEEDTETLLPLIRIWKKAGIIINERPEVAAGILRGLFVLTLHQKEIGKGVYHETMAWYIDQIVEGLIKKE